MSVTLLRRVRAQRALFGIVILGCFLLPMRLVSANDIRITNLTVHPFNSGDGEVEFDLTWRNSWRSTTEPYNWDAAWIFCKLRRNGGDWTHLKLKTSQHTIPSTPQAITTAMGLVDPTIAHNATTNPALGIFLYRANDGFGTFTANDMRLRWNYADNGASSGDVIEIRVVGTEMVYIPQGAFYAGDNATSAYAFREKETGDNDPWYISSESQLDTTAGNSGSYFYPGPGDAAGFSIAGTYPKGYAAFYIMKGEFSQSQWVAFFNMLTNTQKTARDITSNVDSGKNSDNLTYRNNVSWTSGDATLPDRGGGATYSGVAVNYISWLDMAAYLDWAGLRPMTELEYEKAARGPKTPVSGEYVWGSTVVTTATTINNPGLANERGQTGSNVATGFSFGLLGPLRVGSFTQGVDTREGSGGGFYGAMDLAGNLWDRIVTVGNSSGRALNGRYHGNGELNSSGDANVTSWPGADGAGVGARGGTWLGNVTDSRLSERSFAVFSSYSSRDYQYGGRGVRSAP